MKTKILGLLISSLLCASVAQARFYLGVEGGYIRNFSLFTSDENNANTHTARKLDLKEDGVVGNIVLGTEHFFGKEYFGLRWGVFAGYGSAWGRVQDNKTQLSTTMMGLNFDLFGNFIAREDLMSGFFAGIEYAYTFLSPKETIELGATYTQGNNTIDRYVSNKTDASLLYLRVGISTQVQGHHRFEIMTKIPLSDSQNSSSYQYTSTVNNNVQQKIDDTFKFSYSNIQALVSYKYVF